MLVVWCDPNIIYVFALVFKPLSLIKCSFECSVDK